MKKIILSALLLFCTSIQVKAAGTEMIGVLENSLTVSTLVISSYTPTQVDPTGVVMLSRTALFLQNLDEDYDMFCSEKSTNMSIIPLLNVFKIPKNGGIITIDIRAKNPNNIKLTLFCLTKNPASNSVLAIIQAY